MAISDSILKSDWRKKSSGQEHSTYKLLIKKIEDDLFKNWNIALKTLVIYTPLKKLENNIGWASN